MRKVQNILKGHIRDKVKQVLLIDGTPSFLYTKGSRARTSVKINNHTYAIGTVPDAFVEELKKIPGLEIMQVRTERLYSNKIDLKGIGNRTTIRKVNNNTHITVGGCDESQLTERIERIKEYLISNGVLVSERCHWVCSVDKSKEIDKNNMFYSKQEIISKPNIEQDNNTVTNAIKDVTKETVRILPKKTKKLREMTIKMGLAAEYDGIK